MSINNSHRVKYKLMCISAIFAATMTACGGDNEELQSTQKTSNFRPMAAGDSSSTTPATFDVRIPITTETSGSGTPQVNPVGSSYSGYNIYQTCRSCFLGLIGSDAFKNYIVPSAGQLITSFGSWGLRSYISTAISSSLQSTYGISKVNADSIGDGIALMYVGPTHYALQRAVDGMSKVVGGRTVKVSLDPNASLSSQYTKFIADILTTDLIFTGTFGAAHQIRGAYIGTDAASRALTSGVAGATAALASEIIKRRAMSQYPNIFKEVRITGSRIDSLRNDFRLMIDLSKKPARNEFITRLLAASVGSNLTGTLPSWIASTHNNFVADGSKSVAALIGWFSARRLAQYMLMRGPRSANQAPAPASVSTVVEHLEANSRMRGETIDTDSPDALIELLVREAAMDFLAADLGTTSSAIAMSDADFRAIQAEVKKQVGTLSQADQSAFVTNIGNAVARDMVQRSTTLGKNSTDETSIATASSRLAQFLANVVSSVQAASNYVDFKTKLQAEASSLAQYLASADGAQVERLFEQDEVVEGTPDTIASGSPVSTTDPNQMAEVQIESSIATWDALRSQATAQGLTAPIQQTLDQIRANAITRLTAAGTKSDPSTIFDQGGHMVLQSAAVNGATTSTGATDTSRDGRYRYAEFLAGRQAILAGNAVTPYQKGLLRISSSFDGLSKAARSPSSVGQVSAGSIAGGVVTSVVLSGGGAAGATYAAIGINAVSDATGAFADGLAAAAQSMANAPTSDAVAELINSLAVEDGALGVDVLPAGSAAAACVARNREKSKARTWFANLADLVPMGAAHAQACAAPPAVAGAAVVGGAVGGLLGRVASIPIVSRLDAGRYGYFERGSPQPFTLTGVNFPAGITATYNGQSCAITSTSSTKITGTCPPTTAIGAHTFLARGVGVNGSYSATIYTHAPAVQTVNPSSVMSGAATQFSLTGHWFTATTSVQLNGNSCPVASWTPGSLVANCPGVSSTAATIPLQVYEASSLLSSSTSIAVTPLPLASIDSSIYTGGGGGSPMRVGYRYNANAKVISPSGCSAPLSFASTDSSVVSVDASGNITAVAPGKAGVSVSSPGVAGACAAATKGPLPLSVSIGTVSTLKSNGIEGTINNSQARVDIWGQYFSNASTVKYGVNIGTTQCQNVTVEHYGSDPLSASDVIHATCDVSTLRPASGNPAVVQYAVTASRNGGPAMLLPTQGTSFSHQVSIQPGTNP